MDDSDFYSLSMDDAPTAQEKARALAAALRQQSSVGLLGQISGDKVLSPLGAGLEQRAQQGQALLAQAGEKRVQRQTEAQHYAQLAQYHQQQVDNGAEALGIKQELADRHRAVNAKNGETLDYDPNTGEATTLRAAPAPKLLKGGRGSGGVPGPKAEKGEWKDFANAVSTTTGRGNLNAQSQNAVYKAEKLEALLNIPDLNKATPQQVREASSALAALVSGGNAPALAQVEELTPESYAGEFAKFKQKLLNHPEGANAAGFLENMLDTAKREKALAQKQMRAGQLQHVPNFAHLKKMDAARYSSILQGAGLDPASLDENGLPVAVAPSAPTAGAAQNPVSARIQQLIASGVTDKAAIKAQLVKEGLAK